MRVHIVEIDEIDQYGAQAVFQTQKDGIAYAERQLGWCDRVEVKIKDEDEAYVIGYRVAGQSRPSEHWAIIAWEVE